MNKEQSTCVNSITNHPRYGRDLLYVGNAIAFTTTKSASTALEIGFSRELTEDEQDDIYLNISQCPDLIDWRDGQTLWVWDSLDSLNQWLESINP